MSNVTYGDRESSSMLRASVLLIVMLVPYAATAAEANVPQKPNIVVVLFDDLGYGDVSCLSAESKIRTPEIDALAAAGVSCTDAHSPSAVCSPTRYALLTGRYAWRHRSLKVGVLPAWAPPVIEPDRPTLPRLLAQARYDTACIGKWHLGFTWPLRGKDLASMKPRELTAFQPNADMFDWQQPIGGGPLAAGFASFFGVSSSNLGHLLVDNDRLSCTAGPDQKPSGLDPAGVMPELTRRAVAFIEHQRDATRPFFLYFAATSPHTPIAPATEFQGKTAAGPYGDFVLQSDDAVGRIVTALKAIGKWDDTILVVTSDNGPEPRIKNVMKDYGHFPAGPLRGMKWTTWEGGHRVPFIASWPRGGVLGGQRCTDLICLVDLYATLSRVAGAVPMQPSDSIDVMPTLEGAGATRTEMVYHGGSLGLGLRRGRWAYLEGGGGNREQPEQRRKLGIVDPDADVQLFDLEADLSERRNLAADHPDVVRDLAQQLNDVRSQLVP